MKRNMRVLISGAGVAGPALAFFLAKTGARITVLEKAHGLLPHGQNVDLTGSAITVIRKMGLLDEVKRHNTTEQGTQFFDSNGRAFAPFPIKEGSSASLSSEFEILRADLAKILYNATKDHPNVEYVFGATIKSVLSNDDTSVKVESSNGDISEFDLLVAADGQWSKIRKAVFPPESVTVVDKGMTAVYYTIPRAPTDTNWWNIHIGLDSRIVTTRPDPHGTTRAMFSRMPNTPEQKAEWAAAARADKKIQHDLVRRDFSDMGWQTQRLLDAMDSAPDFYFHVIQQIKMSKWSNGRVICLGDAAFAPSPLTGMGTSLAVMSAYMLAGELSKLNASEHPGKALESYEASFRPFVEETQKVPSILPGAAHPRTTLQRWCLETVLSSISWVVRTEWLAKRFGAGGDAESRDDGFKLPVYASLEDEVHSG